MTNTWSQTVIFPAITTNLSPQRTGVVIKHIIINTADSQCDRLRTGPLSVGAAIDRFNIHSAEVSTLYPHYGTHGLALPFGWTNGVPTKPIYCHDTLPATPTNTPSGFGPGWPRVYQRHTDHCRGQNVPHGDQIHNNNNGHTRLCLLTGPGYRTPITFPHWRHRLEA